MKKSTLVLSSILLLASPLSAFANESEAPTQSQSSIVNEEGYFAYPGFEQNIEASELSEETQVLYSGPIGGDEDLKKPFSFAADKGDTMSPQVVINDSANFSWEFEKTTYGSDKLVKNGYSWLATGLLAVPAAYSTYGLTTLFASTKAKAISGSIAGSLWGKGIKDSTATQYTYWTVNRYVDKDSYNVYHKYVVRTYRDKAKTSLIAAFTEVNSNRYR